MENTVDAIWRDPKVQKVWDTEQAKLNLHNRIKNDYKAQPPRTEEVRRSLDYIAGGCERLAHKLIDSCPIGRELSLALTDLESAKRNAIAAIVLHQDSVS